MRAGVPVPDGCVPVLIVGAGPVGLLLACELRRARVPVVIVDRLASPMSESRASQLNSRTAELLHDLGFDALLAEAAPEPSAHFGGLPLDLSGVDSDYAGNWKVPQYRTESALGSRARQLGAEVLRACELTEIDELDDHVRCGLDGPAGRLSITARYVVGCDGAVSTVRRLCGFTASVTEPTKELLRADVTGIEIPGRRFQRLERGFAVAATRDGVTRVMVHAYGSGAAHRPEPPEFAEVSAAWQRVTGDDIAAGRAIWVDSFDNGAGLVTSYREGRVFLAGDAAHWHMPIGGQALNVGLQDAVNLGWKLAGSVHGWAPTGVLDSYHAERHPEAASVLAAVAAQELLLIGDRRTEPLRAVLAELLGLDRVRDHLARTAAGIGTRCGVGQHPLTGRRVPRVVLRNRGGEVTTADLMAGTGGVLLRLCGADAPLPDGRAGTLTLASGCRLRTIRAVPARADVFGGVTALLVRPDNYVAWAGWDFDELDTAVTRWFGAPLRPERRRSLPSATASRRT
jgi:2-polyprenyl-6-methoxyphenol hydroxylase-like FAD-dependent oxidoreductase